MLIKVVNRLLNEPSDKRALSKSNKQSSQIIPKQDTGSISSYTIEELKHFHQTIIYSQCFNSLLNPIHIEKPLLLRIINLFSVSMHLYVRGMAVDQTGSLQDYAGNVLKSNKFYKIIKNLLLISYWKIIYPIVHDLLIRQIGTIGKTEDSKKSMKPINVNKLSKMSCNGLGKYLGLRLQHHYHSDEKKVEDLDDMFEELYLEIIEYLNGIKGSLGRTTLPNANIQEGIVKCCHYSVHQYLMEQYSWFDINLPLSDSNESEDLGNIEKLNRLKTLIMRDIHELISDIVDSGRIFTSSDLISEYLGYSNSISHVKDPFESKSLFKQSTKSRYNFFMTSPQVADALQSSKSAQVVRMLNVSAKRITKHNTKMILSPIKSHKQNAIHQSDNLDIDYTDLFHTNQKSVIENNIIFSESTHQSKEQVNKVEDVNMPPVNLSMYSKMKAIDILKKKLSSQYNRSKDPSIKSRIHILNNVNTKVNFDKHTSKLVN